MASFTRAEIEAALDSGKLFAKMRNGREWQCRRNGRTQTWKTRPWDYSIPFKVGLKECGRIDPRTSTADYFTIRSEG